ncbi:MAG: hypothetical protein JWO60_406 [Frankiales bacterium]|nr:hypothetical protein [Frankiales bacterium]
MDYWLFDLLAVALPAALLLRGRRPGPVVVRASALLAVVALVWTAPWDEHLVRTGVWSYGPDRVLATLGSVPVEEYAFVVLLVGLVAAWGTRLGLLVPGTATGGSPARGAAGWVGVAVVGALLLLLGGPARYLGLLLVWAAPPLALQHAVAGDLLGPRRAVRLALAAPVALWLCAADRLALADGVWQVSPASSSGVLLLGLPVEEALFFGLTTLLVADGLLLAVDPRALARARRLLARARATGSAAPARPEAPGSAGLPLGPRTV